MGFLLSLITNSSFNLIVLNPQLIFTHSLQKSDKSKNQHSFTKAPQSFNW